MLPLIVFDMDGVLTESKQPIKSDIEFLVRETAETHDIAVITGSSFEQMKRQLEPVKELIYFMPLNGARIYKYQNGEYSLLYKYDFDLGDYVEEIVDALYETSSLLCIPEEATIHGPQVEIREMQVTFSALGQDAPLEEKIVFDPDCSRRTRMVEALRERLPDFNILIGGTTSVDVTPFTKKDGVRALCQSLGISAELIVFVGDNYGDYGNDASMLESASVCFVVKSPEDMVEAIEDIKWCANYLFGKAGRENSH